MAAIDTGKPPRADARRNRERIIAAARSVFASSGPEAQIDDVAREAGVGVGTVYRHFPTKEALMVELVRQKLRLCADNARVALTRQGDPFEVLTDLMHTNAQAAADDATMAQTLSGASARIWDQALDEQQQLLCATAELIARAQRAGSLRADIDADDVGMLMCAVCSTMAHASRRFDWRRHLELTVEMLRAR